MIMAGVAEFLIYMSLPRKRESIFLTVEYIMDFRLRGNDDFPEAAPNHRFYIKLTLK